MQSKFSQLKIHKENRHTILKEVHVMKWLLKYILQNITHSEGYFDVNSNNFNVTKSFLFGSQVVMNNVYGQKCLLDKYGNIPWPLGRVQDHHSPG